MTKNQFACCDRFISSPQYTYRHDSLNQTKFNDHFIVSQALLDQNKTHGHQILDDGDNNSDHLPLLMKISLELQSRDSNSNEHALPRLISWKKLSRTEKNNYSSILEELLLQRQTPLAVSSCPYPCGCESQLCHDDIQREYDEIRSCILSAS